MDTTQESRIIFDTLEEDGQVVVEAEKNAKEEEHIRCCRPNYSRAKHRERQHGVVTSVVLPDEKQDEGDAGTNEQADHNGAAPGIALTTPFKSHEEHDSCGKDDSESDQVQCLLYVPQRLPNRRLGVVLGYRHKNEQQGREATDGEVDVEA